MSKYGHRTHDWFEAIVNKLGGEAGAEMFLRNELVVSTSVPGWREENGIIYLSVTLDKSTTGAKWIPRTETKGNRVEVDTKNVLCSTNFKSSAIGKHEIVVLKGSLFKYNNDPFITKNIRAKAKKMNLRTPNADISCLIREQFTDKEIKAMGLLCIVIMHEPIEDSVYDPYLLTASRDGDGRLLAARNDYPDDGEWNREYDGFAFLAPQVP